MAEPIAGSPIKTAIEQAIKEVKDGLGEWELKTPLELEMSVVAKSEGGGKIEFWILGAGATVAKEQVHKIKLSIGPKDNVTEAEKKARIEKAKSDEVLFKVKRGTYLEHRPNAIKAAEQAA